MSWTTTTTTTGQDDLSAPTETPAFATLITTDGRPVRLDRAADGGLALSIGGRGKEVVLDRFQASALLGALTAAMGDRPQ